MNPYENLKREVGEIEKILKIEMRDKDLLCLAFVHSSFIHEYPNIISEHNERLEFLGDSVLGLIIADFLYKKFPAFSEGRLSFLKSSLVSSTSCYSYMAELDLEKYVLLGKGERESTKRGRESILANAFEAIIGAIYLDGGFLKVQQFLLKNFEEEVERLALSPARNFKAELQEYSQKKYQEPPLYEVVKAEGPEHRKFFLVSVSIGGKKVGKGEGLSKKAAEQKAAEDAVSKMVIEK